MMFATLLTAAIGYALIYVTMPDRNALRTRTRASIRRSLVAGGASLLASAVLGGMAVGPVTGPFVACAAALAAGSLLVLFGPFAMRDAGSLAQPSPRERGEGESPGS